MSDAAETANANSEALLQELAPMFDIPLLISIEVGRVRLRVRDLLRLAPGSVLELKKPAGEPFDVCVNRTQVARGEVIMVEQSSGVRIVEVFKPGSLTGASLT